MTERSLDRISAAATLAATIFADLVAERVVARLQTVAPAEPELLTVEEVAARLRLTPATVYRWTRTGRLAAIRRGRTVYVPARAVERLLEGEAAAEATPPPPAARGGRGPPGGELPHVAPTPGTT